MFPSNIVLHDGVFLRVVVLHVVTTVFFTLHILVAILIPLRYSTSSLMSSHISWVMLLGWTSLNGDFDTLGSSAVGTQ